MCSDAIYWAGIGRVVYGQAEKRLRAMTGSHAENPTLDQACRTVFAAGQRYVEVVGPLLKEEAAALQSGFWTNGRARSSGELALDPPRSWARSGGRWDW